MIHELLKKRWSPVSFSSRSIEDNKLKEILEASSYAPSSMNEQPWLFILVKREDKEVFNDVIGLLNEGNKIWAKNAYAFIISLSRMKHLYKERPNRYAFHDTGMAVSNMLLQAISLDIYIHQMGGFSVEKTKQYFRLAEDIEPVAIMALGYLGDGKELPEEVAKRDRSRRGRKNISEYAFSNSINNPIF
jgi:nitroreductase